MENGLLARRLACIACALLFVSAPSAASAQAIAPAAALSNLSLSKSEAILGETSALAKLLASQRGVSLPEVSPLQPASLPRLSPTQAVVRTELSYSPGVR